jgi:hypothetical protein
MEEEEEEINVDGVVFLNYSDKIIEDSTAKWHYLHTTEVSYK